MKNYGETCLAPKLKDYQSLILAQDVAITKLQQQAW